MPLGRGSLDVVYNKMGKGKYASMPKKKKLKNKKK